MAYNAPPPSNPYTDPSARALWDQYGQGSDSLQHIGGPWGQAFRGAYQNGAAGQGYGDLAKEWQSEAPLDYSGEAQIGQFYNNKAQQLSSLLAARGIGGSGIEAGAQAQNVDNEGNSVANYIRGVVGQRSQQHFQELNSLRGYLRQLQMIQNQRDYQKQQNKGGFWKDLLGVAGTVGGALIGGPGGAALGGKIGGLFGGGGGGSNNGYSDFGQPGGSYDPYTDTQAPWASQSDVPSWMMP